MDDENATKLYRVRRTILEMLNDRGYNVLDEELSQTKEDFIEKVGDEPKKEDLMMSKRKLDSSEQIRVFFPDAKSDGRSSGNFNVGIKDMKEYVEKMKRDNIQRAIMVVAENLTPFAKACLGEIATKGYFIEVFQESELLVNISHHVIVPKHYVLSSEEKMALLKRYCVKETQPAYYAWKADVVELSRRSSGALR
ncbi:DNA-directed RNA polymerase subunit 5 family protein [Klebsormidium nitens]|uniref:DNA-directed RNA polymerase subunit 5 family protein n=1 Tax=Klebsormidium nitens TaxID=105231 RepID=A0A0U9HP40_KLENI|nr:DNA-directed RNA polymerase subunit 5 family protein [Klebsormidium nitens]|eukprot:GAQ85818.1 DNA-directed RNA polymerase subunit 5 family protein [Klebsormidium nitens]